MENELFLILQTNNLMTFLDELLFLINCRSELEYRKLPQMLKMVVGIDVLIKEISNGGFHQFLANSSGNLSEDIKVFLKSIDAYKTLDIFDHISSKFPDNKIPEDRILRNDVLDKFEESDPDFDYFDKEDKIFVSNNENLLLLLKTYLINNSNELSDEMEINKKVVHIEEQNLDENYESGEHQLKEILDKIEIDNRLELIKVVKKYLEKNDKIGAMKYYRKGKKCSLEEAKKFIETLI